MRKTISAGMIACTAFLWGWLSLNSTVAHAAPDFLTNKDPALLSFGAGKLGNIFAQSNGATAFTLEYRAGKSLELLHIRPSVGLMATTDNSYLGWLGINLDLFLGDSIVVTPQLNVGTYAQGDGDDLGGILQFRSGAVFAWRFENRARLGVTLHHISNAGAGDDRRGTETLMLQYSHPMSWN